MAVATATFLTDTVLFIRDDLITNITDPITHGNDEKFVMTSYPQRNVKYPIITIKDIDTSEVIKMGMQSELKYIQVSLEIRIWARNVVERDKLAQQVLNRLRANEFGSGSSTAFELHDFTIFSAVNIDEPGDAGIHSKVIEVGFKIIFGS